MNEQPTYDPLVANQENFDPITLIPVFGSPLGQQQQLQTPTGAPINFYIPPPAPSRLPPVKTWQDYLPYLVGFGTIALLIAIYFIIRHKSK